MAQEAVRVGQAVVQEAVVPAWEVLVSGKEGQTGEEPAAVQGQQMRHPSASPLCAASVIASPPQSPQSRRHHHPQKTPPLPVLPQGSPDLNENCKTGKQR